MPVRIGCYSAFWGDSIMAAHQLVHLGHCDYIVADYLAEVTMGILAKKQKRNQTAYVKDFVTFVLKPLLSEIQSQGIKVVTNAGGLDPVGLKSEIEELLKDNGVDMKVAAVYGDDICAQSSTLQFSKFGQLPGDSEGLPQDHKLESLNAYLGAEPIARALNSGAQIVVTGRVVDSAVVLGPLIHEFKWNMSDYDLLAAGCVAGHIVECGCQATGGNFTDWRLSALSENGGYSNMGYPIVEVEANGSFVVTKPPQTGGIVSVMSVGEQLVYEIGDPAAYILPDVVVDFRLVTLEQVGKDRVLVKGARGYAPTEYLKCSGIYMDGYKVTAELFIAGTDAAQKALAVGEAIIAKASKLLENFGMEPFTAYNVEAIGAGEHTYGPQGLQNGREVVMRLSVAHMDQRALNFFLLEIAPSATCMAPGIIGVSNGRPRSQGNMVHFSCLVRKSDIAAQLAVGQSSPQNVNFALPSKPFKQQSYSQIFGQDKQIYNVSKYVYQPLIKFCVARSGDKGDSANIGVIARNPKHYGWLKQVVTQEFVYQKFQHLMQEGGRVQRFELPGVSALNFVITLALGGGGLSSLQIDRQGKTYAQQLLTMLVPVPKEMAKL